MRYFCQADVTNEPYLNSLFRYNYLDNVVKEEYWDSSKKAWLSTSELTRLFVTGDCTLMEISKELSEIIQNQVICVK